MSIPPNPPLQQTGRTQRAPPHGATVCGPLLNGNLVRRILAVQVGVMAVLLSACTSLTSAPATITLCVGRPSNEPVNRSRLCSCFFPRI